MVIFGETVATMAGMWDGRTVGKWGEMLAVGWDDGAGRGCRVG